jgi:hypothetical protein
MIIKFVGSLFIVLFPMSILAQTNSKDMKTVTSQDTTLVCKLTSKELQERKKTVVATLKKLLLEKKETDNGFRYKFEGSDNNLDLLNDFIKTERMCCDFFTFQLTVEEGTAWLELSGPVGTKDFIKDELEL